MNINEIAKRIAGDKDPNKVERLLKAEANLIKELYPQLKKMSLAEMVHYRYEVPAARSDLAAIEIVPLIFGIMANPSAHNEEVINAAREYVTIAEDGNLTQDFLGEEWRVWSESEIAAFKDKGDPGLIEKAMKKTVALRGRRQDVERKFEELLEKGFNQAANEEFNAYIRSIQDEIDNAYYDDWGRDDERIFND